ncbi:cyclic nucleotide-binding-like protein [Catenaria anguillulae PL171]|uniref:Cyclic nucleotide-binding-like protein n=1 Tax=Catenaria anguillulae PL171 TaxID=765915 RepID=A0A1Y2HAH0_9FUNG|nr:cyclic nucleotide-binding-like protein [Catenaria anguillulae PL171]
MVVLLVLNGLGTLLIAGYVALFVSYLSNTLRDKVVIEQTIQRIRTYLRYHRISHHAAQRVVDYYRHILHDWHGQICTDDVLSDLPVIVRSEVTYMVRGSHLEQCPLFTQCSLPFVQFLCANSTELYLSRAETLTVCGAGGTAMFVIKQGHAHVLSDDNRRVWGEVGPGGMVGEVATLFNQTHSCTVVALYPCEVIVIPQHVLNYAIEAFPDDGASVMELVCERQRQSLSNLHHARLNTVSYPPAVFKRIPLRSTKNKASKGEKKVPFARRKDRAAALREELVDAAIFVVKSRWLKKASKDRRFSNMSSADTSAATMSMSMSGASSFFGGTAAAPPIIARMPTVTSPSSPASSSTHSISNPTPPLPPATVLIEPAAETASRPRQRVRTNSIVSFTKPLGPIAEVSTGQTMPRPRQNKSLEMRLSAEATSSPSTRATPSLDAGINFVFTSGPEATPSGTPSTNSVPVPVVQSLGSVMMAPPPLTVEAPSTPSLISVAVVTPPLARPSHLLYDSIERRGTNEDRGRPLTVIESNESFVSAASVLSPGTSGRQSSSQEFKLSIDQSADTGLHQSVYLDALSKNSDQKSDE